MRFANLLWAIKSDDRPQYRLAAIIGISDAHLSRCLSGRSTFTDNEKRKLAAALGYSEAWLFQPVKPPTPSQSAAFAHA